MCSRWQNRNWVPSDGRNVRLSVPNFQPWKRQMWSDGLMMTILFLKWQSTLCRHVFLVKPMPWAVLPESEPTRNTPTWVWCTSFLSRHSRTWRSVARISAICIHIPFHITVARAGRSSRTKSPMRSRITSFRRTIRFRGMYAALILRAKNWRQLITAMPCGHTVRSSVMIWHGMSTGCGTPMILWQPSTITRIMNRTAMWSTGSRRKFFISRTWSSIMKRQEPDYGTLLRHTFPWSIRWRAIPTPMNHWHFFWRMQVSRK